MIKFPSQSLRDEALKSFGSSLLSLSASFMPWSSHSSSVFTIRDEGFWIRLEDIPHHLWNVDMFHRMLGDFAELLEVDMSLGNVKFLDFARLWVRLHAGKDLPELKYFAFSRHVYPIRFCRSWDLCHSSASA